MFHFNKNHHDQQKKGAASANVEAAAASVGSNTNDNSMSFLKLLASGLQQAQGTDLIPSDAVVSFTVTDKTTGKVLLHYETPEKLTVISSQGTRYELPVGMVEQLKKAAYPRDVVNAMEAYRKDNSITYNIWKDDELLRLCIHLTGKNFSFESVSRTLINHRHQKGR